MNIAFIFAGQGSQSIGMGKDFFDNSQIAKDLIQSASDRLHINFEKLLFSENNDLDKTEFTQPAILLVSSIALKLFRKSTDIKPKYVLGHSLGEFSALIASGVLDIDNAVELTHKRGLFMAQACQNVNAGMMALVGAKDDVVEKICESARKNNKQVWCANYNSDGQIVLAGIKEDLISLEEQFKEVGVKKSVLLNMSVASHCPLLESARVQLDVYLNKFLKENFIAPVISNVTAKKYSTKEEAIKLLSKQLINPVLYKQSITNIENEVDMFIEFGNGSILKGLNKRITNKPTINISDTKSLEKALEQIQ